MTAKGMLKAIGLADFIQIGLLVFAIFKFGFQMDARVKALEAGYSEMKATLAAQAELDHQRDVALGRLIERTHMAKDDIDERSGSSR